MTEFMTTTVVVAIIASLTYLIHTHPDSALFAWSLIGFIGVITLTGVYTLHKALNEK